MFESTYDMLIKEGEIKGEAIGIQKGGAIGERKRSLENVLDGIRFMPSPSATPNWQNLPGCPKPSLLPCGSATK